MTLTDRLLDATLLGYTRLGARARGIDVDEPFPALEGRSIVVTGATGGIGRAVVERLAANGARVHAVGRSPEKVDSLASQVDGDVVGHVADLSSMEQIVELGAALPDRLDGLVNNVGVMTHARVETDEGFELTYAVNLLGPYLLTRLLIPALARASDPRVVFVSSGGMYLRGLTASNIDSSHGTYDGTTAYARTKRGQVVLAEELAVELAPEGIVVTSMHPGWVDTEGVRTSLPAFRRLMGPLLRAAPEGADTIVWLLGHPEAASLAGEFVHDRCPRPKHRMKRTVEDAGARERFLDRLDADASHFLRYHRKGGTTHAQDRQDHHD